jgi:hypothetical protein
MQMRFVLFLIVVAGILWTIDTASNNGRYSRVVEEQAGSLFKAINNDAQSLVNRMFGKS